MWPHQRQWWDSRAFIKALVTGYGGGKAQPLDSLVLTPTGWVCIGDLHPGDLVMSPVTGKAIAVESIHPQGRKEVFSVLFSNGVETLCCDDHLWAVLSNTDRSIHGSGKARVLPLSEIRKGLTYHKLYKAPKWSIPTTMPLEWEDHEQPLDPYLLGALLGDGSMATQSTVGFSCADADILEEVRKSLPEGVYLRHIAEVDYNITTGVRGGSPSARSNPVLNSLRALNLQGKTSYYKFVPKSYLFASSTIRLHVLQGLMDTDGYITSDGSVNFNTSSEQLKDDVLFLVESLGGIVTERTPATPTYRYKGEVRTGALHWTLYIKPNPNMPLFRCQRKQVRLYQSQVNKTRGGKPPIRYIKEVRPAGMKECVCIKVAREDGLYITDRFVVTHNTMIAAKRAISLSLVNAPSPHLIVSPSIRIAKKTVVREIKELLVGKQTIRRDLTWKYFRSDAEFRIWLGGREATIWIASGDDPDTLKGPNVGSANIDEPFIQSREVFNQILARVRDPVAKVREIGLTGTPEDLNWGYDICEGEEADNFDIEVIHASSEDNLALDPAYAARMRKGFTDKASEAYVDGRFISLSTGLVYYAFGDDNIRDYPVPPDAEVGVGMDFNVNPMALVVFWRMRNHIHVFEELELENSDTQFACQLVREKFGNRIDDFYPDASGGSRHTSSPGGRSDFHYIREAGFTVNAKSTNPSRRDRYNAVNGKFRPGDGSEPSLTVSPNCKKLISYLKRYSYEKLDKEEGKKMSHLLDAFGYPVVYIFPVHTPILVTTLSGY
jgi:hypothetical protein